MDVAALIQRLKVEGKQATAACDTANQLMRTSRIKIPNLHSAEVMRSAVMVEFALRSVYSACCDGSTYSSSCICKGFFRAVDPLKDLARACPLIVHYNSALNISFERSSLMTAAAAKPALYNKAYARIRTAMGSLVVTGNEVSIDVFAVKLGGDPKVAPEAHHLLSLYKSNVTASLDVQQRKSLLTDTPLNHAAAYALALERVGGVAITQQDCRALAHALADGTTPREVLDAKAAMARQCEAGGGRTVSRVTAVVAPHSKAQRTSSSDAAGATLAAAAAARATTGKGKQSTNSSSSSSSHSRARDAAKLNNSSSTAALNGTAHDDGTALRTEQDLVSEVAQAAEGGSSNSNTTKTSSSQSKQDKHRAAVLLTPRERRARLLALPVNPAKHPDYIAFLKAGLAEADDSCSDDSELSG
jgi:hypothetical protein